MHLLYVAHHAIIAIILAHSIHNVLVVVLISIDKKAVRIDREYRERRLRVEIPTGTGTVARVG